MSADVSGPKLIDRKPDTLVSAPAWAVWLYRLRWIPALAAVALCAAVWPVSRQVPVDASNNSFVIRDNFSWYEYENFNRVFTAEESIAVGLRFANPIDAASAAVLTELEAELKTIPGVHQVRGLAGLTRHHLGWFGRMEEKPLFGALVSGKENPESFLADREHWPPPGSQLLSADGRTAAVIVTLKPDAPELSVALDAVRRAVTERLPADAEAMFTGTVLEQRTFGEQIDRDRRAFVPLCVGVIVALLIVFHLDLRTVLYSLVVMGGSLTLTEALMTAAGGRLHAVTALLAPVILIVAVSSTIKACGIFDLVRNEPLPSLRLVRAIRGMFVPIFLANLTTFIGFISLLVSRVPAVRDFGAYGAAGTAFAFLLTMLAAPLFATWPRMPMTGRFDPFEWTGKTIARLTRPVSWLLVALAVVFVVAAVRQIPQLQTSTDLIKIFKPSDPFRRDTELFIERLGGVYPLEILVEPPTMKGMRTPDAWDRLDRFEGRIEETADVSHVTGPTDVIRYFEGVVGRPRSEKLLGRMLDEIPEKNPEGWRHFAGEGNLQLRFTALLTTSDTARVMELARQIPQAAGEVLGSGWRVSVTGETRLLAEMSQQLVHDEAASVLTAFCVILALIILILRSAPYAFLGVLPNFVPIAGLFGLMSLLGIGLNTATAMIASVAIGLVFDNTVYLLCGYREARAAGMDAEAAVTQMLSKRFKPVIASSLILMGGFGVTMFGHMVPTVQFGFLSCATIGLVTLSDLFVLPALLRIFKPR